MAIGLGCRFAFVINGGEVLYVQVGLRTVAFLTHAKSLSGGL